MNASALFGIDGIGRLHGRVRLASPCRTSQYEYDRLHNTPFRQ